MKLTFTRVALLCVTLAVPAFTGCEQSHSETTKNNLLGGQTHEETTVTKNPITGDTSVEHDKQVTH